MVEQLRKILQKKGWDLEAVEVDLKRGDQWDLSDESLQDSIIKDLEAGKYHGVICTPPCSTCVACQVCEPSRPTTSSDEGASVGLPMGGS